VRVKNQLNCEEKYDVQLQLQLVLLRRLAE